MDFLDQGCSSSLRSLLEDSREAIGRPLVATRIRGKDKKSVQRICSFCNLRPLNIEANKTFMPKNLIPFYKLLINLMLMKVRTLSHSRRFKYWAVIPI